MRRVQSEFLKPFCKAWKGAETLTKEEFCKVLLSWRNDDVFYEVETLCHKILETFEKEMMPREKRLLHLLLLNFRNVKNDCFFIF